MNLYLHLTPDDLTGPGGTGAVRSRSSAPPPPTSSPTGSTRYTAAGGKVILRPVLDLADDARRPARPTRARCANPSSCATPSASSPAAASTPGPATSTTSPPAALGFYRYLLLPFTLVNVAGFMHGAEAARSGAAYPRSGCWCTWSVSLSPSRTCTGSGAVLRPAQRPRRRLHHTPGRLPGATAAARTAHRLPLPGVARRSWGSPGDRLHSGQVRRRPLLEQAPDTQAVRRAPGLHSRESKRSTCSPRGRTTCCSRSWFFRCSC